MSTKAAGKPGFVITIDLGALAENWRQLAAMSAPAECTAVVKADAYGLGIEETVPALWAAGCRTFFVALADEGRRVREAAPEAVIYVLNGYFPDWDDIFRAADLRPVLSTFAAVESWAQHADGRPSALQVDTGMNRLGLTLHEALELARHRELMAAAAPELLMSHLACADAPAERRAACALPRDPGAVPAPSRLARQFRRHPARRRLPFRHGAAGDCALWRRVFG